MPDPESDSGPDPDQNDMDPQHYRYEPEDPEFRIHDKMIRIQNFKNILFSSPKSLYSSTVDSSSPLTHPAV